MHEYKQVNNIPDAGEIYTICVDNGRSTAFIQSQSHLSPLLGRERLNSIISMEPLTTYGSVPEWEMSQYRDSSDHRDKYNDKPLLTPPL